MDKKYQVFVSSTFKDLVEERKSVIWQLQSMGYIAVGMEAFPSSSDNAWKVITRQIDMSDYYVLILKNTYGSAAEDGISYTEKEYDYAVSKGMPVLAFMFNGKVKKNVDYDANKEAEAKLQKFRSKVDKHHTRTTWKNADELNSRVAAAIATEVNIDPREGWVRARISEQQEELLLQNHTLRIQYDQLLVEKQALEAKLSDLDSTIISRNEYASGPENFVYRGEDPQNPFEFKITWDELFLWIGASCLDGIERISIPSLLLKKLKDREVDTTVLNSWSGFGRNATDAVVTQLQALGLIYAEPILKQTDRGGALSLIHI